MDMTVSITAPVGGNRTYGISSLSETKSIRTAREPLTSAPESLTFSHQTISGGRRRSLIKFDANYADATGISRVISCQLVLDRHVASAINAQSDHLFEQLCVLLSTAAFKTQFRNGEV